MNITINILYTGKHGNAKKFAEEMTKNGIVDKIRKTKGNLRYEYFLPLEDKESVLLIDSWESQAALDKHHASGWESQAALDKHHASATMQEIVALRDKYDLHMSVKRYVEDNPNRNDEKFIRE